MKYSSSPPTPDMEKDLSSWDVEATRSLLTPSPTKGGKLRGYGAVSYGQDNIKLAESAPHGKPCPAP